MALKIIHPAKPAGNTGIAASALGRFAQPTRADAADALSAKGGGAATPIKVKG